MSKTFEWQGQLPLFQRVRQNFSHPCISDIPSAVNGAIDSLGDLRPQLKGKRVAITAGSRGITGMVSILSTLVARLRSLGADPFIVPAMGSHAGATAEGQCAMLADLGMTEASLGAPVVSSMETVELGRLSNGMPVYMDRHAASADAIILVNRVKPHTDFSGPVESGLSKIAVIGLGKLQGANTVHRYGVQGLRDLVPEAARLICRRAPVLFGLASVENAYHELAQITAVPPEGIAGPQEQALLKLAYQLMPRFPFPEIDVLVIDEMGKNISGVGMDTKVIGRMKVHGVPDLDVCTIRAIAVLRLTPESHGNAAGIGLADVTTQKLVRQIDFESTYLNCVTSGITGIQRTAIPLAAPTDKAAIETALRACGRPDVQNARVVRIKNTVSLGQMDVSVSLLPAGLPGAGAALTPVGEPFPLPFNEQGDLLPF